MYVEEKEVYSINQRNLWIKSITYLSIVVYYNIVHYDVRSQTGKVCHRDTQIDRRDAPKNSPSETAIPISKDR